MRRSQLILLLLVLLICCSNFDAQVAPAQSMKVIDSWGSLSESEEKSLQKFIHSKHRGRPHGLNLYSRRAEREMGERAEEHIDRVGRPLGNEALVRYLDSVARKLAANSSAGEMQFRFKLLPTDEVNAMSLPNGVIYVNSGLLLMARSEAELAGVIAHEIAHIAARHASRAASRRELWGFAAFGVAIATGGIGSALEPLFGVADSGFGMKFSRDNEREADLLALTYLDAAGYDPQAYVSFLHRLTAREESHGALARMAATHPASEERVRRAQRAIELMFVAKEAYISDSSDFDWARRTVLELTHPGFIERERPVLRTRPRRSDVEATSGAKPD
jgi:beta-barrel assembly-enhancing protease